MVLDERTDKDLINRIKNDDKPSFEELFDRYWEMLFRFCNGILEDEELCQDIIQEIFTDLWQRRKTWHIENIKAFLFQAVRNKVAKHIRHIQLKRKHLEAIAMLSEVEPSADMIYELKELRQTIDEHLKALPNRCHQIFKLSRFEHYSNKEIASQLNISIRTVETQISRATRHLRTSLKPELLAILVLLSRYSL